MPSSNQNLSFRLHDEKQRGISLIMVLLVLMLVALTALSASRSAVFNESVTGNEADYNRAVAAAEAMVRDAQIDIVGELAPGVPCNVGILFVGCRLSVDAVPALPTLALPFFPQKGHAEDGDALRTELAVKPVPCVDGLCAPALWPDNALPDRFWLRPDFMTTYVPLSATYGQHTLQVLPGSTSNPILTAGNGTPLNKTDNRAWYWVELIPDFVELRCGAVLGCPSKQSPFMYRITAVAQGRRDNTLAVIQTYFVPIPPTTP